MLKLTKEGQEKNVDSEALADTLKKQGWKEDKPKGGKKS